MSLRAVAKQSLFAGVFFLLTLQAYAEEPKKTDTPDTFRAVNYRIFQFNEFMDKYLLKPVAKGYDKVVPKEIRKGIGHFFNNMEEPGDIVNSVLQWKMDQANILTGRFIMNTTVGVVGLWDPATGQGYPDSDEDFGLTMAKWGINSGPYVVLPFFGPSTARDAVGKVPDWALRPSSFMESDGGRLALRAVDGVDTRARLLSLEDVIIGDKYIFFRDAWLSQRYLLIHGEEQEDDFIMDEDTDDDWGDDEGW